MHKKIAGEGQCVLSSFGDHLLIVRKLPLDQAHDQCHATAPSQATVPFEAKLYLLSVIFIDEALELCFEGNSGWGCSDRRF